MITIFILLFLFLMVTNLGFMLLQFIIDFRGTRLDWVLEREMNGENDRFEAVMRPALAPMRRPIHWVVLQFLPRRRWTLCRMCGTVVARCLLDDERPTWGRKYCWTCYDLLPDADDPSELKKENSNNVVD